MELIYCQTEGKHDSFVLFHQSKSITGEKSVLSSRVSKKWDKREALEENRKLKQYLVQL